MDTDTTLQCIDLVRERTGASYAEAWSALRASRMDVVRAIVAVEEGRPAGGWRPRLAAASEAVLHAAGEAAAVRMAVRRGGRSVVEIPAVAGLALAVCFPRATAAGLAAALVARCSLALERPVPAQRG